MRNALRPAMLAARTAEIQHGAISDDQLIRAGWSEEQIRRAVDSGRLHRCLPGIVRIGGAPDSWRARAHAAVLWGGQGCALSGLAAAHLHGFERFDEPAIEISVTAHRLTASVPIKVHRVDKTLLPDIVHVDGLPVTSIPRTFVELCARKHPRAARLLSESFRRELSTPTEVVLYVERHLMWGRRGRAIARAILLELTGTEHLTGEDIETQLVRLLRSAGFPDPSLQFRLELPSEPRIFDAAYPGAKLLIEADGYLWHKGRREFTRDRRTDVEAGIAGWSVLRFTWGQIMFEPHYVVDAVRAHLQTTPHDPLSESIAAAEA